MTRVLPRKVSVASQVLAIQAFPNKSPISRTITKVITGKFLGDRSLKPRDSVRASAAHTALIPSGSVFGHRQDIKSTPIRVLPEWHRHRDQLLYRYQSSRYDLNQSAACSLRPGRTALCLGCLTTRTPRLRPRLVSTLWNRLPSFGKKQKPPFPESKDETKAKAALTGTHIGPRIRLQRKGGRYSHIEKAANLDNASALLNW